MGHGDDDLKSRKRFLIIGVSSILLVAMVVAVTVSVGVSNVEISSHPSYGTKDGTENNGVFFSMKAIEAICKPTDYKRECVDSLHSAAGNSSNPEKLIRVGFTVAMEKISVVLKESTTLQEIEKEPRAKKALDTCKELLGLAVEELEQSVQRFETFHLTEFKEMVMDLKVFLSATITYQETCLDAFENTSAASGEKMKKLLETTMHLTSNGLAMVSQIANAVVDLKIPDLSHRRLLAYGLSDIQAAAPGRQPVHSSTANPKNLPAFGSIWRAFPLWSSGRILLTVHSAATTTPKDLPDLSTKWYVPGLRKLLQIKSNLAKFKPHFIVAKDGSGDSDSITTALKQVPKNGNKPFVIYIKEGVYNESVRVNKTTTHVVMIGDGADKTRITGNNNFWDGTPTYHTATVAVHGAHFMAMNIGFENSAGPEKHQAVALRVSADQAIFYNCSMDGYQDTLYTHVERQFYSDCTISGTIDFVFGDAAAILQNCTFLIRKPLPNQNCIVTAQGRKDKREPTGIIIQNSTITGTPDYYPLRHQNKAYLGRPWKEHSRTIIMESYIDDVIAPQGWLHWEGDFALQTCFYAEFRNSGPGHNKALRVKWRGIKNITRHHAADFTVGMFFKNDAWIKRSGVPYVRGLTTAHRTKNATSTTSS